MSHSDGTRSRDEQCADGTARQCGERGTSDCRREGGRGRRDGSCRRGHGADDAAWLAEPAGVRGLPAARALRIAVCASGPTFADRVHERFGRAECFQLVDPATMTTRVIVNDVNRAVSENAGLGAVELLAEHGAQVAIVTMIGPKAAEAFQRAGIAVYQGADLTVGQAVAGYLRGELTSLDRS